MPHSVSASPSVVPACRVIQVGPSFEVRGGITSVEKLIAEVLRDHCTLGKVDSSVDGSAFAKLQAFGRSLSELRKLCRSRETHIVHIHFASSGSTLRKLALTRIAKRAGHVVVLHAHGGGFDEFLAGLPSPLRLSVVGWLQSVDHLIVLSSQWERFYRQTCGVDASRVSILPNPVRLPASVPAREPHDGLKLVYFGRMSESKGTFDILRAVDRCSPDLRAKLSLTLAGDGAVTEIREFTARLGDLRSTVLEWVDEPTRNRLLTEADAFILPSYAEGIPMSLLEAMAFGLPVITTPVGGIPDVVDSGEQGLLVKPGDIDGLAAAISRLADPITRQRMGVAARARAERFDLNDYGSRLRDIYRQALEARPPAAVA
ncbi:MAG: glycosyltransferase family 4 protein [Steroidobacteraceae bacterium]